MVGNVDEHLKWLELQRSKRTFNIGDYNIKATPDYITVRGKTSETWGRDLELDRSSAKVSISTESRTCGPSGVFITHTTAVGAPMPKSQPR